MNGNYLTGSLIALRYAIVTMVLTGVVYPLAVTGIAMVGFPSRANGSLLENRSGKVVGSRLIGQNFKGAGYFQPRPSAAGDGYDANASSGSNLGPSSTALRERVQKEVVRLTKENPAAPLPIPEDMVTASASGLDPHISTDAALWQAERIALARNVSVQRIKALIEDIEEAPTLGFLGEPRVNVLEANLALDKQFGDKHL